MPVTINGTQGINFNSTQKLQARFNEAFEYRDGKLFWKVSNTNSILVGQQAGTQHDRGYRRVYFDGKTYSTHRIVWVMFNGDIPKEIQIDHINGDASDNRIENLRMATNTQNCQNRRIRPTNSGIRNVSFVAAKQKYRVSLQAANKRIYCGAFEDLELAELVSIEARLKYHGKFARVG